jgi:hypothetical protein
MLAQVQPQLTAVQKAETSGESFARTNYDVSCEVAVNEQVTCTGLPLQQHAL